jgi:uncharacterized protein involved in exopolysaccharide biosynthesis
MNAKDLERAERLYRILVGRPAEESELLRLASSAASYAEFRVRLIADHDVVSSAQGIADTWRSSVAARINTPDPNDLMHTLEQLAARQTEIERKLRERDTELLDKLRQLDTLSHGLGVLRDECSQLRLLLTKYREAVLRLSEQALARTGGPRAEQG